MFLIKLYCVDFKSFRVHHYNTCLRQRAINEHLAPRTRIRFRTRKVALANNTRIIKTRA